MLDRALDLLLLGTILGAPWAALILALAPFWALLRRDWRWFLLVAGGLWLFMTILLSPLTETFAQSIIHVTTKPWFAAYTRAILEDGRAPLWLPQLGAGLPALANPYVAYMSPFTSLLLFFRDLDHGVNMLVIVHLVFAGLSTLLLGRTLGLSKTSSLFAAFVVLWNPWVFGKLGTAIHALYLFAYAWIPLTWALLLHFLRTKRASDAARTGIPLAWMAISMPTVFAHVLFAVLFVAVAGLSSLLRPVRDPVSNGVRRRWKQGLLSIAAAVIFIPLGAFLTAAPEHLAARELLQYNVNNRFGIVRMGGWRDLDLSTRDFLRALFPNELGQIFGARGNAGAFGVPFSPGDLVVLLAFLGLGAAVVRPSLRARAHPIAHAALFLVVASVATHGIFYEPMMRGYALWAASGNWPVAGAILLLVLVPFSGIGFEALLKGIRAGGYRFARLLQRVAPFLGQHERIRRFLFAAVPAAGALLLVFLVAAELLWGLRQGAQVISGTESDHRLDLRFTIPKISLTTLRSSPHLEALQRLTKDAEVPPRIHCIGDIGRWPSPCFEHLVDRHRLGLVGIGELAWSMPKWQWRLFTNLWGSWKGQFSLLFTRALQLSSTDYVVSSRALDLPLLSEVFWAEPPTDSELWGGLLKSSIGGGPWPDVWDQRLRIHQLPNAFPRAFFADAVRLEGTSDDQDLEAQALLSDPDVHLRTVAFLHTDPENERALSQFDTPVLRTPSDVASRQALLGTYAARGERGWSRVKVNVSSPHPGVWSAEGRFPHPGAAVFTQMYYPGFRATVNGRSAPVARADLFITAVPVPGGESVVRLAYVPYLLLLSSVLPVGFLLFLWWRTRRIPADAYDGEERNVAYPSTIPDETS